MGVWGYGSVEVARWLPSSLFPLPLLLIAFLAAMPVQAQQVRATLSADSLSVGERATLSIVAEHGLMTEAVFPGADAGPRVFGDLTVIRRLDDGDARYGGQARPGVRIDSAAYEVTTFALDTARVPPLAVRLTTGTDTAVARTPSLEIPVRSVVPEDAQGLRGMAPPAEFPRPLWPYLLLGLAAAALLAMLGVFLWRRYYRTDPEPAAQPRPAPSVPPYEAARERLRRLEAETDLANPAALKPFYVALAGTLRTYLAQRTGVRAAERTTRELLADLERRARQGRFPDGALLPMRSVLTRADLAKFADARPTPDESRAALADARAALDAVEEHRRPRPPKPAPVSADAAS